MDGLTEFYADVIEFEIDWRRNLPPDRFEAVYQLQADWTLPIRNAIHDLLVFLQKMREVSADGDVEFMIEVEAPPNIEEFQRALESL